MATFNNFFFLDKKETKNQGYRKKATIFIVQLVSVSVLSQALVLHFGEDL